RARSSVRAQTIPRPSSDESRRHRSQGGFNRGGERPGGVRRQLHRDPRGWPPARVAEIDVERVLGPRVLRVVEVDGRLGEAEPARRALAAALDGQSLGEVGAHDGLRSAGQVPAEEVPDLTRALPRPALTSSVYSLTCPDACHPLTVITGCLRA